MSKFHLSDILTSQGDKVAQINSRFTGDIFLGTIYDLSVLEYITRPHYACVVCTRGWASFRINFETIEMRAGDMIIKFDTDILINNEHSPDFETQGGVFSNDQYEKLATDLANYRSIFLAEKLPNLMSLSEREMSVVNLTLDQFSYILESLHEGHIISAMSSALSTFGKIAFQMMYDRTKMDMIPTRSFSRSDTLFKEFIELVVANYREQRSVGFYADRLSVTPKHLSSVVKSTSHRKATEWIDNYVISEAKTQLLSTDKPIYEIADSLHFESATLFSRYFRRITDLTPRTFRENNDRHN